MADKVSAFALQQKAKAIEAGLIHDASPVAPLYPPKNSVGGGNRLDDIKSELQALRELLSKPAVPPAPVAEEPKREKKETARPKQVKQPPTRVDALKAMLGR